MYNFSNVYNFNVLKRADDYLAVLTGINSNAEMHHYHDQGYVYWGNLNASNAALAVSAAKMQDSSTISALQAQVNHQQIEIQRLLYELNMSQSQKRNTDSPFDVDPLQVLGLEGGVTSEEITARYKILANRHHKDKNGSDFLMALINTAYDKLGGRR